MINNHKKTIGYLRVSTADQGLDKNTSDILLLANEQHLGQVQFIEETTSGKKIAWRKRQISKVVEDLKDGVS